MKVWPEPLPLDHPIWHALTTTHAPWSVGGALARRYPAGQAVFAATVDDSAEALRALADLFQPGESAALFTRAPVSAGGDWTLRFRAPLPQMIWRGTPASPTQVEELGVEELGAAQVPEMLSLVQLTRPGPFGPATYQLGEYVGIRQGGQLVAMAGERLRPAGFSEISAVCTHPGFQGRGYASALVGELCRRVTSRGETPFLHLAADNERARRVYERLGFVPRAELHLTVLQRG